MDIPQLVFGLIGVLVGLVAAQLVAGKHGWTVIACISTVAGSMGLGYALGARRATNVALSAIGKIRGSATSLDVVTNLRETQQQVSVAMASLDVLNFDLLFLGCAILFFGGLTFAVPKIIQALKHAVPVRIDAAVEVAQSAPKGGAGRRRKREQNSKED